MKIRSFCHHVAITMNTMSLYGAIGSGLATFSFLTLSVSSFVKSKLQSLEGKLFGSMEIGVDIATLRERSATNHAELSRITFKITLVAIAICLACVITRLALSHLLKKTAPQPADQLVVKYSR